jgi:hypothetical protein
LNALQTAWIAVDLPHNPPLQWTGQFGILQFEGGRVARH